MNVDSDLEASHTPATTDASDTLALEDGVLSVAGSNAAHYHLEGNELKVTAGAGETIASTAIFTKRAIPRVITFEYNHNGLRTKKTVEEGSVTTTYEYTLHGKLITHMTKRVEDEDGVETSKEELHFSYDAQSKPAFVEYNGEKYCYVHNFQGDIVAIVDAANELVVEYKYDTWGKLISTSGNLTDILGKRNPFRYRGYVYDEESGLCYLRSRYYNPEWCRFVNADEMLYGKILTANVFAYCQNRPVSKIDETGKSSLAVGIGLASGGWTAVVSGAKAIGVFILKLLGVTATAGTTVAGIKHVSQSVSSSNADEQTDAQPAPGPAPTINPSAAPKTTLAPNSTPRLPDYPGDDPEVAPEGYEWRGHGAQGSPRGNYHNPNTGESLHPDLNHEPPIGPHWDYWGPDGVKVRIFPPK